MTLSVRCKKDFFFFFFFSSEDYEFFIDFRVIYEFLMDSNSTIVPLSFTEYPVTDEAHKKIITRV